MTAKKADAKDVVIEDAAVPEAPDVVTESPSPETDATKSRMTGPQLARYNGMVDSILKRTREYLDIEGELATKVHAAQVLEIADMLRYVAEIDGVKDALARLKSLWAPFLDHHEKYHTMGIKPEVRFKDRVISGRESKVSPDFRQRFLRWADLSRWTAGAEFYRRDSDGVLTEQLPPAGGVSIRGHLYAHPGDALRDGNTFTDVYQAWKNVVRPPETVDLAKLPTIQGDAATKQLISDVQEAMKRMAVVVRVRQKVAGKVRLQKKSVRIEKWNKAMYQGAIIGLLGLMAEKVGIDEGLRSSVQAFMLNPPTVKTETEEESETE